MGKSAIEKAFPPNELHQSQNGKSKWNSDWNQTQPIRQYVERPMHARQRMERTVDRSKVDAGAIWPDWLHIHAANQKRPQHECCKRAERDKNGFLCSSFSCSSFLCSELAFAVIHFGRTPGKRKESARHTGDTNRVTAILCTAALC